MELNLTHALILTQFESSLIPLNFESVAQQDYTVHAVLNRATKSITFFSEPKKFNGLEEVIKFKEYLTNLNIPVNWEETILIISDEEYEYCVEDVKKHFNL